MIGRGGSPSSKTTFQKLLASIGLTTDAMAGSDTGASSQIGLMKRISSGLTSLIGNFSNYSNTGTINGLNQEVSIPIGNRGAVGIQIGGSAVNGVITFYGSMDGGSTWDVVYVEPYGNSQYTLLTSTHTGTGKYLFNGGGFTNFKAKITTAPDSGTFNVSLVATPSLRNVGVPSIGSALDTAASSDTGSATLIQLIKRLLLKTPAVASDTFAFNAAGQNCQVAVSEGHRTVSVTTDAGSISGTMNIQYSRDGGATWLSLMCQLRNAASVPTSSITVVGFTYDAPIPAETTHVRIYMSTYVSGAAIGKITVSSRSFSAPQTVWAYLSASASRIGVITAAQIHYQDTVANLTTGSPSFTGTWRDCCNALSGNAASGGSSYAKTFSTIAAGDQPFNLYVDISDDGGTTTYRTYKVAAAQLESGGLYLAEITMIPKLRWARVYANMPGDSNMTKFTIATAMLAN